MNAKGFLLENGIPNMPTQFAKEEQTEVLNTEQALESYHQAKLKLLGLHNVVRCCSCGNNNDFSETSKQEIRIEDEYRYVIATTCNKCGKAVEIHFFD